MSQIRERSPHIAYRLQHGPWWLQLLNLTINLRVDDGSPIGFSGSIFAKLFGFKSTFYPTRLFNVAATPGNLDARCIKMAKLLNYGACFVEPFNTSMH